MTLVLKKVRGQSALFVFEYDNGQKKVVWHVDGNDVEPSTLFDILDSLGGPLPATQPAIPHWIDTHPTFVQPPLFDLPNEGAAAADKAAREEEQRLMNMGAALSKGINMGPTDIPVFNGEAGDDLPPVNWEQ